MEIVDAQLHEPGPWFAWDGADVETRRRVLTETLYTLIEAVGVDAVLFFPVEDLAWAESLGAEQPGRFGSVPMVTAGGQDGPGRFAINPTADDVEDRVAQAFARPGVRALRIVPGFWPEELGRFDAGGYDRAFAACEEQGVPVFLFISGHLDRVGPLAARYPNLRLVVDHLGLPQPPLEAPDSPPFARLPGLLELAVHPNVAVKLCGAPSLSLQPYPFEDVWAPVRQILDAFGASRVMWASDISRFQGRVGWALRIPGADQHYTGKHSYAESLALYRDTNLLSQSEKELVLGGTVRRLLGWSAG